MLWCLCKLYIAGLLCYLLLTVTKPWLGFWCHNCATDWILTWINICNAHVTLNVVFYETGRSVCCSWDWLGCLPLSGTGYGSVTCWFLYVLFARHRIFRLLFVWLIDWFCVVGSNILLFLLSPIRYVVMCAVLCIGFVFPTTLTAQGFGDVYERIHIAVLNLGLHIWSCAAPSVCEGTVCVTTLCCGLWWVAGHRVCEDGRRL
jgi:hypothetical protein